MEFIERILRLMTHLNIGAMLGMAAWVLWSGALVVTGEIRPPPSKPRLPERPACCVAQGTPAPVVAAVLPGASS